MSESPKFKEALEKFKISYDIEFQEGYECAIDKISKGELTAPQVYSYSNLDARYYGQIRRDIGRRDSDLFLRGFVKACKDIVEKSEEKES